MSSKVIRIEPNNSDSCGVKVKFTLEEEAVVP